MSEDHATLEERFLAATARELAPGALLDDETASLRETWLALGELLDGADAALDERVVLRQVRRRRMQRRLWQAALVAVAASLLAGAAVAWRWTAAEPPGVASEEHQRKAPAVEHLATTEAEPEDVDFDWNDPLDTEIASAGEDIRRAEQRWGRRDGLVDVLWEQMQELEQGMSGQSL